MLELEAKGARALKRPALSNFLKRIVHRSFSPLEVSRDLELCTTHHPFILILYTTTTTIYLLPLLIPRDATTIYTILLRTHSASARRRFFFSFQVSALQTAIIYVPVSHSSWWCGGKHEWNVLYKNFCLKKKWSFFFSLFCYKKILRKTHLLSFWEFDHRSDTRGCLFWNGQVLPVYMSAYIYAKSGLPGC